MLLGFLLALFISGFLLWLVRPHNKPFVGWLSILPPGLITGWLALRIPEVAEGNFHIENWDWMPSLGLSISFRLDGLALLFGLIVAGVGAAVALYTHYYLEKQLGIGCPKKILKTNCQIPRASVMFGLTMQTKIFFFIVNLIFVTKCNYPCNYPCRRY